MHKLIDGFFDRSFKDRTDEVKYLKGLMRRRDDISFSTDIAEIDEFYREWDQVLADM